MKANHYQRDFWVMGSMLAIALATKVTAALIPVFYIALLIVFIYIIGTHNKRMKELTPQVPLLVDAICAFNIANETNKIEIYHDFFREPVEKAIDMCLETTGGLDFAPAWEANLRERLHNYVFDNIGKFPTDNWNYDGDGHEVDRYISLMVSSHFFHIINLK